LATFAEFTAPAHWRAIDFVSDLHLGPRTTATFDAFAHHLLHTPADAVFLLGDIFEAWIGDDARTSGFEQACAQILREAAARRSLAFMAGNRDFVVGDDMLMECGVQQLSDPTVLLAFGRRMLLSHGDELCLADTEYQRYRRMVREPAFIAQFLAKPLDERRAIVQAMRDASDQRRRETGSDAPWADVDAPAALSWMRSAATPDFIHGHTHRPCSEELAPGFTRHVLSDWDLESDAAPPRAEVLQLSARGLHRHRPA
jgi:UDP-2,3-diacylglucosamine hydrolase